MSKWYKASELERLKTLTARDGVNGLPDNHVITVSERTIRIDERELVQNNVSTDTYTLELDAEWDDITPVVIFSNSEGDYKVAYENAPTKIPAAVMAVIGAVDVSVFGLDSTGAVRVVTKAAPNTMTVVESGKFVGEISEDDVSLLGQILAAVEAANEAAENANATVIKSAVATTLNPGDPATANLADHVLTIGVPKGDKGDKGDSPTVGIGTVETLPAGSSATASATTTDTGVNINFGIPKGDKGDKGDVGDKGDPGTAATIAVGNVTGLDAGASPTVVNSGTSNAARFDFGIPKGDKGDTGDPGHTPQRGVDYWTAEDIETVVEDAKAQAVAELAEIGNVPKGTVSGYVAHSEDAYSAKPLEVRIKGRTVKNLWLAINGKSMGITVSTDETGLITITGTPTGPVNIYTEPMKTIKPNTSYSYALTKTLSNDTNDASFAINGGGANNRHFGTTTSGTFVSPNIDDAVFRCQFYIGSISSLIGQPFSWSGRVMLVEGTEVPDCFTPPASITSVEPGNLVTSGKNLMSELTPHETSSLGVTATINDDNSITLNGTATGLASFALLGTAPYTDVLGEFIPGTYTLSVNPKVAGIKIEILDWREQNSVFSLVTGTSSSSTKTLSSITEYTYVRIQVNVGTVLNNVTIYPQLELGSTATAYEPPSVTQTPLPEVELRSLPNGTADELVIGADGACRVERRTKKTTLDGGSGMSLNTAQKQSNDKWVAYTALSASGVIGNADNNNYLSDKLKITNSLVECAENVGSLFITPNGNVCIGVGEQADWNSALAYGNELLASNPSILVCESAKYSTEPQTPVTLPVLPAPTFNVYHDSDVPSDTSATYTRDINIALADLEAQIADLVTKEAANV